MKNKKLIIIGIVVLLLVGFVVAPPDLTSQIFNNFEDALEYFNWISGATAEIEGEFEIYDVIYDLNGDYKEYFYKFRVDYHEPGVGITPGATEVFEEYGSRAFHKEDSMEVVEAGLNEDMISIFNEKYGDFVPLIRYTNESDPFYNYTFVFNINP